VSRGGGAMRNIASLLFGREAGELLDMITGEGKSEHEAADRVLRSGEWCGSTPGHGSARPDAAERGALSSSSRRPRGGGIFDGRI
jgi:hypothetical protein